MFFRVLCISIVLVATKAVITMADPASEFVGPPGWSHAAANSVDANRTVEQWHISGDVTSLTYIKDTATSYDAAVGAIAKNFATNNIKPSTDRDLSCRGKTGHEVEFSVGPDGHQISIYRIVVPDGAGVDTVTYARSTGTPFDPDVKKSEAAFCGGGA